MAERTFHNSDIALAADQINDVFCLHDAGFYVICPDVSSSLINVRGNVVAADNRNASFVAVINNGSCAVLIERDEQKCISAGSDSVFALVQLRFSIGSAIKLKQGDTGFPACRRLLMAIFSATVIWGNSDRS